MRNVIFGSGIVGLAAKHCLAGDWLVVPFRRSRYFSFNPALGDNFIIRDRAIDEMVTGLGGVIAPVFYRRVYSSSGLLSGPDDALRDAWLAKIFGADVPPQSFSYWSNRLTVPIYDVRVNLLYQRLLGANIGMLKAEAAKGDVTEIGDHYFKIGETRIDFDNAISTIPLPALLSLMRVDCQLRSLPIYYYHIKSDRIDLEGANQALVVDSQIDFYKAANVSKGHYLFYSTMEINNPGAYFLQIIGPGEIIDGTNVVDSIPAGPMPDLSPIEKHGIFCIGSLAQHDWCSDVGSNFLRLVRYGERGYKPA